MRSALGVALALTTALLLTACAPEEAPQPSEPPAPETVSEAPTAVFSKVTFADLPGWTEDRTSEALPALRRSCGRFMAQPNDRPIGPDGLAGTVADWRDLCEALQAVPAGDDAAARQFFEAAFTPYAVSDGSGTDEDPDGLFTGYYEIELRGARQPSAEYSAPLYRRPADMVTVDLQKFRADLPGEVLVGRVVDGRLQPYLTREAIDEGALDGDGLELLWLDDPVDAFFLHIQGSGRVQLENGERIRVGYAASNGHPFFGIARTLIDNGSVSREDASMQAVRDWLRANPDEARELMYKNRRYIFFREIEGEGPIGAMGLPLTAMRSLAVDPAFLPLGAPLWLDTTWPAGGPEAGQPMRRLMVAQDTGSAIKGPVRGDFFWGTGEAALDRAGGMKQTGRYYLLLPRAVAERRDRVS
jgi:membrane-bound lytic murein transglycosylase A